MKLRDQRLLASQKVKLARHARVAAGSRRDAAALRTAPFSECECYRFWRRGRVGRLNWYARAALLACARMRPRLTVVTLGVADLRRAREFYEALGWRSDSPEELGVVFFPSGDMVLALWGREELANDSGVSPGEGWGGVTLAHNVDSAADVDRVVAEAKSAGATIARAPGETFWGGHSGVFVDLDGHPWEVAHNPHWTLTPDGGVRLPDA